MYHGCQLVKSLRCDRGYRYTAVPADRVAKGKREKLKVTEDAVFLVPTAVGYTHTNAHTRRSNVRGFHLMENIKAQLLYRGCLAFQGLLWYYQYFRNSSRGDKKRKKTPSGGLDEPGWLWLHGKRSRDYLPVFATLNAQSKRHGARLGPKLAPWCTRGPPACPAAGTETVSDEQDTSTWYTVILRPLARSRRCSCQ